MPLQKLQIYPVKSARKITLERAEVSEYGFNQDRNFAFIDSCSNIITAREAPKLLQLNAELFDNKLRLSNGEKELIVDIASNNIIQEAKLFGDKIKVSKLSYTENWLSAYLGCKVELVKKRNNNLVDDAPIHLISSNSLHDLNAKLKQKVTSDNFRPNIVVRTNYPYEEETWRIIKIGDCSFEVIKNCARCSFSTINNHTSIKNAELLKTLATYKKEGNGVTFGIYLKPINQGTIKQNDYVEVID